MARGIYIGTENFISHSLPSGYTQVEYIQSSGTQYIDALFAGGCANGTTYYYVEVFDKSLTRTIGTDLTTRRFNLAAATVGDYALFGGGYNGDNYLNSVEAFTLV